MASIYLIRHGQASFGSDDYDQLSPLGFEQASHLGKCLFEKHDNPQKIYCGTLRRHKETLAKSIAAFAGLSSQQAIFQSDWNEFDYQNLISVFNPEWTTPANFRKHLKTHSNPDRHFFTLFGDSIARWVSGEFDSEYAESWREFKQRIHSGLETVVKSLPDDGKAFVFTSGGPIACLVMSLLDIPDNNLFKINRTLVNCGVTKLITNHSGVHLSTLNDHTAFDSNALKYLITYK